MMSRKVSLGALACCLLACVTSPTGRKQLVLLPDQQMATMGDQAFSELKQKVAIERDPRTNAYIDCIVKALLQGADSKVRSRPWEVVVFRDDSANAFALPGGKIGVHTGLLKVAVNQDQVATVIGHELAHVLARHSNERVSEAMLAQGGLAVADAVLQQRRERQILMGALGLGAQFGLLMPHSRKQEAEADHMGLLVMAKAGFDPEESTKLWQNMSKAGGGSPPEFLSTHPSHGSRIKNLQALLGLARPLRDAARGSGLVPHCAL